MAYCFEESALTFGAVLHAFGIYQALILGHSDGGAMGVLAAVADPDKVLGVRVCAPTVAVEPAMIEAMKGARTAFESGSLA